MEKDKPELQKVEQLMQKCNEAQSIMGDSIGEIKKSLENTIGAEEKIGTIEQQKQQELKAIAEENQRREKELKESTGVGGAPTTFYNPGDNPGAVHDGNNPQASSGNSPSFTPGGPGASSVGGG